MSISGLGVFRFDFDLSRLLLSLDLDLERLDDLLLLCLSDRSLSFVDLSALSASFLSCLSCFSLSRSRAFDFDRDLDLERERDRFFLLDFRSTDELLLLERGMISADSDKRSENQNFIVKVH